MVYSTKKFLYDKKTENFSQEASTLGIKPGKVYKIITLESQWTKKLMYFALRNVVPNGDEVGGWTYWNKQSGITCTIWND